MPFLVNRIRLFFGLLLVAGMPFAGNAAWVQKASFGGDARHRCTGFSIGTRGYIGGGHTNSGTLAYFKDYWEYDPATNCWTQIADFGGGYRYHSTAFSIGNYAYVGLGENESGAYENDFWKYIPLINTWAQVAPFPGAERRGACAFTADNLGYVGTGQTEAGYAADFYVYNPATNNWDTIADFAGEARSSAVAFAFNGKGYVGTGHVFGDDRNDFFEYDPATDTWTQKADAGPIARQDATAFVVNGEGYVGTGNNTEGTENFGDFWKYSFESDTWTEAAGFDGQSRRYMVSFVIGNVAYCGTGTNGTNLRDFWAFYPLLGQAENAKPVNPGVFPNPAADFIQTTLFDGESMDQLILADMSGRVVFSETVTAGSVIPLNSVSEGTYLLLMLRQNEIIHTTKLEIKR
ncbi:MAG: T9SS type A sorting domain-containing protein [Bacteroidetes bacterium]|nr:T9SS type A sorting domain-containing protein [Bacteroidota bacterium]